MHIAILQAQAGQKMTDTEAHDPLIAHAVEEAAQAVFSAPDAPIALLPELRAAIQGSAVRGVLEARVRMIVAGHDAEADDMLPIGMLPLETRHAIERAQNELSSDTRDLEKVRALLIQTAAFALASIDRLDRALKRLER
jgi:hypothetical protein